MTTPVTRRSFLGSVGAFGAAAVAGGIGLDSAAALVGSGGAAGASTLRSAVTPAASVLSRSAFTPLLKKSFTISGNGASVNVPLAEIGDLAGATPGDDAKFWIAFKVPLGSLPGQGLYSLRQPSLGTVSLLLVPIDRRGLYYQAVINR